MGKRVLVTGGAGFLGSHLCEKLLKNGDEVIALDNLFTGNKRNIKHLYDYSSFEFVRHDVIEPILLEEKDLKEGMASIMGNEVRKHGILVV